MAGQLAQNQKSSAELTQVQAAVQVMEEETKKLRAAVEALGRRLHDVITPATPATPVTPANPVGEGFSPVTLCPLTDMMLAQFSHVQYSRSIVEDLLSRIQL